MHVGFHTYDYARHFLSACGRVLEVDTTPRGLEYASHFMSLGACALLSCVLWMVVVKGVAGTKQEEATANSPPTHPPSILLPPARLGTGVFPIGIDPDHILHILQRPAVHARIKELTATFAGRKVLLGVDRLDYIKGMPHKLLALELFLTRFPEWRGKVTLIQVRACVRALRPSVDRGVV